MSARRAAWVSCSERTDAEDRQEEEKIDKALKSTFRPEFLNRIDEIIIFSPLSMEQMRLIVDLQMKEIQDRLRENGLEVELTRRPAIGWPEEGYDPNFGARPLRRALQKFVESPLVQTAAERRFLQRRCGYR